MDQAIKYPFMKAFRITNPWHTESKYLESNPPSRQKHTETYFRMEVWYFFPTISGFFNVSTCFHGQSLVVQQKKLLMVMFLWVPFIVFHLEVSWNGGTFKSSILVGCSIINHLFWGTPMAMESPIYSARECVYAVSELPTWARSPASSRTHLAVYPIFVWICSHIYTEYIWYIYTFGIFYHQWYIPC